jgi:hypothetical protein
MGRTLAHELGHVFIRSVNDLKNLGWLGHFSTFLFWATDLLGLPDPGFLDHSSNPHNLMAMTSMAARTPGDRVDIQNSVALDASQSSDIATSKWVRGPCFPPPDTEEQIPPYEPKQEDIARGGG